MQPSPPTSNVKGFVRINSNTNTISAIDQMKKTNEKLLKQIKEITFKDQSKTIDNKLTIASNEDTLEKEKAIYELNAKVKTLTDTNQKLNYLLEKRENSPLLRITSDERLDFWNCVRSYINEKPMINTRILNLEAEIAKLRDYEQACIKLTEEKLKLSKQNAEDQTLKINTENHFKQFKEIEALYKELQTDKQHIQTQLNHALDRCKTLESQCARLTKLLNDKEENMEKYKQQVTQKIDQLQTTYYEGASYTKETAAQSVTPQTNTIDLNNIVQRMKTTNPASVYQSLGKIC